LIKGFAEDLLLIGKVIRPHGLKGLLKIGSYAQSEESFLRAGFVFLKTSAGRKQGFKILSVQPSGKNFLLKLEGLSTLDQAEPYRGAEILIDRKTLGADNPEEYFWADIIGLKVYADSGKYLGTIAHIFNNGSHDIYVIKDDEQERLIPAVRPRVKEIRLQEGKMIVFEMEEMPDLNEI
jgi:16S rRNA processing protein RimM